jgi:hypothetical protein
MILSPRGGAFRPLLEFHVGGRRFRFGSCIGGAPHQTFTMTVAGTASMRQVRRMFPQIVEFWKP